jgi:hypothetical protein
VPQEGQKSQLVVAVLVGMVVRSLAALVTAVQPGLRRRLAARPKPKDGPAMGRLCARCLSAPQ